MNRLLKRCWTEPETTLPEDKDAFELCLDDAGQWSHWSARLESFSPRPQMATTTTTTRVVVPTLRTAQMQFFTESCTEHQRPLALYGDTSGRSTFLSSWLSQYIQKGDGERAQLRVHLSSSSKASSLLSALRIHTEPRKGSFNVRVPSENRSKLVVFVDDLQLEDVEDSEALDTLRCLLDRNAAEFEDEHRTWRLQDVYWVSAPIAVRQPLDAGAQRLMASFVAVSFPAFTCVGASHQHQR